MPSSIASSITGLNHPTRCDALLYPEGTSAPTNDAACLNTMPGALWGNTFDPDNGHGAGLMVGYAFGHLRVEVEYLYRTMGDSSQLIGNARDDVLADKNSEWNTDYPPSEWIGDMAAQQVFANVYYEFATDSKWTPYVGLGAGWSDTKFAYYAQFLRKSEAEYLAIDFDPDWAEAARRAAAGTASIIDTEASRNVFGYQAVLGIDYALSESTSVGVSWRIARFDDVEDEVRFETIRSHAPVLADGVTPAVYDMAFSDIGYQAITVNLKYAFR